MNISFVTLPILLTPNKTNQTGDRACNTFSTTLTKGYHLHQEVK